MTMGYFQARATVTDTIDARSSHRAAVEAIGAEVGLGFPGYTLAHRRKRNAGTLSRHNLEGVSCAFGDRYSREQAVNKKQQAKYEAKTVYINHRQEEYILCMVEEKPRKFTVTNLHDGTLS